MNHLKQQHNPPHPGEILLELYLKPSGMNITMAVEKLFISRHQFSDIIDGRTGISPIVAIKLARAFKTTPQFWLNLQNNYDLWLSEQQNKDLEKVKPLV